jgi:nucleoid-associated protein YgaU
MSAAPAAAPSAPAATPSSYAFSIIDNDDLGRPGGAVGASPSARAPAAPASAAAQDDADVPAPAPAMRPQQRPQPAPAAARPATLPPAQAAPAAAPQQRVAALSTPAPAAPATAPAAASARVPAGSFTVQLTSQRSEQEARTAFSGLQRRFPQLLGGKSPAIQKADLGSRGTYYRVKVVAGTREAALQLCSGLKAQGGDCIVGN